MTGTGSGALRALVVDDEEHLARLVAGCLTREGCTAQVAPWGSMPWTSPANNTPRW